jgi:hypothetical protein
VQLFLWYLKPLLKEILRTNGSLQNRQQQFPAIKPGRMNQAHREKKITGAVALINQVRPAFQQSVPRREIKFIPVKKEEVNRQKIFYKIK